MYLAIKGIAWGSDPENQGEAGYRAIYLNNVRTGRTTFDLNGALQARTLLLDVLEVHSAPVMVFKWRHCEHCRALLTFNRVVPCAGTWQSPRLGNAVGLDLDALGSPAARARQRRGYFLANSPSLPDCRCISKIQHDKLGTELP